MALSTLNPDEMYVTLKSQNLTALYWAYLKKQGIYIEPELAEKYKHDYAMTIYSQTQQYHLYESIQELFTNNLIFYLPLKGLAVREFYDMPVLRFSCDLDILIHNKDFSKAKKVLEESGWTTDGVLHFHDMCFYKGSNHLELHFNICENMIAIDKVLADVWKNVHIKHQYELALKNEYFLFHQVAHAYYHYMHGGCGIKAIIDIKVLREKLSYDQEEVSSLLKRAQILDFYNDIVSLISYWFEDNKPSEKDLKIEEYIISGGAYGTRANQILLEKKQANIVLELIEKFTLPRNVMYAYYPKLDACHGLLPFFLLWRWGRGCIYRIKTRLRKMNGKRQNN